MRLADRHACGQSGHRICLSRSGGDCNQPVYQYNATIQQVPALLLRPLFGWKAVDSFNAESGERVRPVATVEGAG